MNKNVEQIFHTAREMLPSDRAAYLKGACGNDLALHAKVEALLAADADAGSFLKTINRDDPDATATQVTDPHGKSMPTEQPGQMIGRYKLLQPIGEGGFGSVWMAEQREPVKRRVALKIIKLGMDTRQVIARFEAERQALAMMDHPNIATVLDGGATEAGRPYFVMELVKGVPITEYCDHSNLSIQKRLDLFKLVCAAVQHAHQKGIIHRDIKPSNVMVTLHDGVPMPKVIDFGIAKATSTELTQKTLFTEHHQMIGTPAYMSPEQAEMSGLDIDTRSDIYALGVLLYELLTGTTPFDSRDLLRKGFAEMVRIIREEEPHKPSTRLSTLETLPSVAAQRGIEPRKLGLQITGDLDWIIMKALEKDRMRRYESASGLAADIERHLRNEPVLAGPPSTTYKIRKFIRRNRGQVFAGTFIAAAVLLGAISTSIGMAWAIKEKQEAEAISEAASARSDRALHAIVDLLETSGVFDIEDLTEGIPQEIKLQSTSDLSLGVFREGDHISTVVPLWYNDVSGSYRDVIFDLLCSEALFWNERSIELANARADAQKDATDKSEWSSYTANLALAQMAMDNGNWPEARDRLKDCPESKHGWEWEFLSSKAGNVIAEFPGLSWLSPDGKVVLAVLRYRTVVLMDLEGKQIGEPLYDADDEGDLRYTTPTFSADGKHIIIGTREPDTLRVYDFEGNMVTILPELSPNFWGQILTSTDGKWIITEGDDNTMRLWDSDGEAAGAEFHHDSTIRNAIITPDSTALITSAEDGTVRIWNLANGLLASSFQIDCRYAVSLAVSPDSKLLVAGGRGAVSVWSMQGNLVSSMSEHELSWRFMEDLEVKFSPDGRTILANSQFGLRLLNQDCTQRWEIPFQSRIDNVEFGSDGVTIISSSDQTLRQWDLDGQPFGALRDLDGDDFSVGPDAGTLFVHNSHRVLERRQLVHSRFKRTEHSFWSNKNRFALHPNSFLRPVANPAPSQSVLDLDPLAKVSAALPDGSRIVTADDNTIRFWDPETKRELASIGTQSLIITGLAFAEDGKRLEIQFRDDFMRVLDIRTAEEQAADVQRRWAERGPAGEFIDELIASQTPTDELASVIKTDPTMSPLRRVVASEILEERIAAIYRESVYHYKRISKDQTDQAELLTAAQAADLPTRVKEQVLAKAEAWEYTPPRHSHEEQLAQAEKTIELTKAQLEDKVEELKSANAELTGQTYVANIVAAQANIQAGEIRTARVRLDEAPSELRGWEWENLHTQLDQSLIVMRGHKGSVSSVAFNPDGSRIVSASGDGTVRLWDALTGNDLHILRGHKSSGGHAYTIWSVAFSPDGSRIAVASAEEMAVLLWDIDSGDDLLVLRGHEDWIKSVAFSPDGSRIASGGGGRGPVRLWDASTGTQLAVFQGHEGIVTSVAFSPDGSRIASAGKDGTVRVWDIDSEKELVVFDRHEDQVWSVAFSPDGSRIASGASDKTVRVWDAESGEPLHVLRGHKGGVRSIAFSPDGSRIASGSSDKTVRLWNAETGEELVALHGHEIGVTSVAFSPDGSRIASGSWDGTVRLWDASKDEGLLVLPGHEGQVYSVAFSPDGSRIASASLDGTVRLWDATIRQELAVLRGHKDRVNSIVFSLNGSCIASASSDKTVRLWDADTGGQLLVLRGHKDRVNSIVFSPDGSRIASGSGYGVSNDNTVRVWDAQTGEELLVLRGHKRPVMSVAFSPDGSRIASSGSGNPFNGLSMDNTVRVWDATTGEQLLVLRGHESEVTSIAFSPDGSRIVSASWDGTVRLWDAESGDELQVFIGHEQGIPSVAFSPDGSRITSASWDNTVRVWDAATGDELRVLRGHDDAVASVAFSPDGSRIVSGSWDATVRLWDSVAYRDRIAERDQARRDTEMIRSRVEAMFDAGLDCSAVAQSIRNDASLSEPLRHAAINLVLKRCSAINEQAATLIDEEKTHFVFAADIQAAVQTAVQADTSLEPAVRAAAVNMARLIEDNPDRLAAEALRLVKDDAGSQADYERAQRAAAAALQSDPADWSYARSLAEAWTRLHQPDKAVQVWLQHADTQRAANPTNKLNLASALIEYGKALVKNDQAADAEPVLRECLSIREEVFEAGHWYIVEAQGNLGVCLTRLGADPLLVLGVRIEKFTEAETFLVELANAALDYYASPEDYTTKAIQRVVDLYEAWNAAKPGQGYDTKASEWQAKLPKEVSASHESPQASEEKRGNDSDGEGDEPAPDSPNKANFTIDDSGGG